MRWKRPFRIHNEIQKRHIHKRIQFLPFVIICKHIQLALDLSAHRKLLNTHRYEYRIIAAALGSIYVLCNM